MSFDQDIMSSVKNLEGLGQEIDLMVGDLEQLLTNPTLSQTIAFAADEETCLTDSYSSVSDWVLTGFRWTFPARRKIKGPGKKPRGGSLSIMIDLGADGRPANILGMPCVAVAWASKDDSWAETLDGEVPFWPLNQSDYRLLEQRLFWWTGKELEAEPPGLSAAIDSSWMYILPLSALGNRSMIEKLIVNPVITLVNGRGFAEPFINISEILRFSWQDGIPKLTIP